MDHAPIAVTAKAGGWNEIEHALVQHFSSTDRKATVRALCELSNFFEGWFTAESLLAIHKGFPEAVLRSNKSCGAFTKPDIALGDPLWAVIAVKHIATLSREATSRWDGAKDSTVAKDIHKLAADSNPSVIKRVLVFYGPAQRRAHVAGARCNSHREFCVECSINHLRQAMTKRWNYVLREPTRTEFLVGERDTFHLLVFAV